MQALKGSGKKFDPKSHKVPPRDPGSSNSKEKEESVDVDSSDKTKVIKVKQNDLLRVPGSVFRQAAFPFRPKTFAAESERFREDKFFEAEVQHASLKAFRDNPAAPMIYGVTGNPSDSKAKYFAAYLVSLHLRHLGIKANPLWYPIYEGYHNPIMTSENEPTIIVLTNLTVNSTNLKVSKARDIVEKFDNIPRIIVGGGTDPLSLVSATLHCELHGLAYFSEAMIKPRVEIA